MDERLEDDSWKEVADERLEEDSWKEVVDERLAPAEDESCMEDVRGLNRLKQEVDGVIVASSKASL